MTPKRDYKDYLLVAWDGDSRAATSLMRQWKAKRITKCCWLIESNWPPEQVFEPLRKAGGDNFVFAVAPVAPDATGRILSTKPKNQATIKMLKNRGEKH